MGYEQAPTELRKFIWIFIGFAIIVGMVFFIFFSDSKTFLDRILSVFKVGFSG